MGGRRKSGSSGGGWLSTQGGVVGGRRFGSPETERIYPAANPEIEDSR